MYSNTDLVPKKIMDWFDHTNNSLLAVKMLE
jgi:hypothetical protein